MIDFPNMPPFAPKWAWILSGVIYFSILLIYNKWGFTRPVSFANNAKKNSLVALVFIFCITAIYCGDWVHMQILVHDTISTEYKKGYSIEMVYFLLANLLNGNYLLFRIVVWGGGLYFLMRSFKESHLDPYRCLFFLFGIYITTFAYSRSSAAHAVFFCGLVTLFQSKEYRKNISLITGIVLLVASVFLHRSMLALVILTPLVLVPLNRRTYVLLLIGVVVLLSFMWGSLFEGVLGTLMESDEYAHRIELYENASGSQNFSFDINGLFFLWYKGIIHIPFWFCIIHINKRISKDKVPYNIQAVYRFSILLYMFTMMMMLKYGSASAFYYRYEAMLYIPITIMVGYLFQNGFILRDKYTLLFWVCALSQCKDFIYRILFT